MIFRKIFFLLFIIIGCQSLESPKKPSTLIEEDRMVEILTEIALLKAAKGTFRKKMEIEKINPEAYILKTFNIDSTIFAENNAWYASDLENYEEIFKKVKTAIENEHKVIEKQQKVEDSLKKINDSIKKASKKLKKDSLQPIKVSPPEKLMDKKINAAEKVKPYIKYPSDKKQQSP